jgi:hypothetical protein
MVNFNGLEGSVGLGLIDVVSRNLTGEPEEDHEKQSGYAVSLHKFEERIFWNVAAAPASSVNRYSCTKKLET